MTRAEFRAKTEPHPAVARAHDRVRQVATLAAALLAAAGGLAVLLAPQAVAGLQGGAYDGDGSYLAVALPAYGIWAVLGLGLVGFALWQLVPRHAASPRARSVGWWIAAIALLDAVWTLAALRGPLWSTVVAAVLVLAVCLGAFVRAVRTAVPQSPWLELLLVDGLVGLHLGFAVFGSAGALAALLTTLAPAFWTAHAPLWGGILVVAVAVAGLLLSVFSRWRITPPLAIAWALIWVAVGRLTGEPYGEAVGIAAAVAAVVLVVGPALVRIVLALRPSVD